MKFWSPCRLRSNFLPFAPQVTVVTGTGMVTGAVRDGHLTTTARRPCRRPAPAWIPPAIHRNGASGTVACVPRTGDPGPGGTSAWPGVGRHRGDNTIHGVRIGVRRRVIRANSLGNKLFPSIFDDCPGDIRSAQLNINKINCVRNATHAPATKTASAGRWGRRGARPHPRSRPRGYKTGEVQDC